MKKYFLRLILLVIPYLFTSILVEAAPNSCVAIYSQNTLSLTIRELFKRDAEEFSKLKDQTKLPGIVDYLEHSLDQQKIAYLEVISKKNGQPYLIINTDGLSKINTISKEVFKRWKILIALDPNFPAGALGSYEGINEKGIKGLILTRTFDDKRFFSNLYHELLHAYLTNLEFQGKPHPLSLYFFRDPTQPYDGIQYGKYLPAQEFATFLRQGILHSESTVKSVEVLFDLTQIAIEFQSIQGSQKIITKVHKGYEAVGVETSLGEFYIPKAEIEANRIASNDISKYLTTKISKIVQVAQTIREVLKPSIMDLGNEIVILKPGLTEQESMSILLQIQNALFEKHPDLRDSLADYIKWTDSFWKNVVFGSELSSSPQTHQ